VDIRRGLGFAGVNRRLLAAAFVGTSLSQALLAVAYEPVNSDIAVYERYAAAVLRGIAEGTSFSVARDRIIREDAQRNGLPPPSEEALVGEYPPLAVAVLGLVAVGLDPAMDLRPAETTYDVRYRLALFGIDTLLVIGLAIWLNAELRAGRLTDRESATRLALYGALGLILGNLIFDRLDLVVGALILASSAFLARGRWVAAYLVLGLAINFKASPIALAPVWVVAAVPAIWCREASRDPWRLLGALAIRAFALVAIAGAIFLPFVLLEGVRAFDFLLFRGAQGIQVESVAASIALALHGVGLPLEVISTRGAYEVQTPLSSVVAVLSPVAIVGAIAVVAWSYVVRLLGSRTAPVAAADGAPLVARDPLLVFWAAVATLLLTLVASKAFSPQYLLWLIPLIPLLDLERRGPRFVVLVVAAAVLTTAIFPYLYGRTIVRRDPSSDGFLDPSPLGVALLIARNAVVVWLAWLAYRAVVDGGEPAPVSAAVQTRDADR
jgi:hypothetical protein